MKRTVPSRLSISSERQGGLAGPNLAGQDDEALAFADPTRKGSVGLLKNRNGVKETRIKVMLKASLENRNNYRPVFIRSASAVTDDHSIAPGFNSLSANIYIAS